MNHSVDTIKFAIQSGNGNVDVARLRMTTLNPANGAPKSAVFNIIHTIPRGWNILCPHK